ncbi:MAG: hypothetical protein QM709_05390 [Spongiibacteraceae bacterium]
MNAATAAPARAKNKTQYADRSSTILFSLTVIAALIYGWQHRGEYYLTAEHGIGYALGIIGGSMMLLLLLYPLRKRLRFMERWAPLRFWFRTHMILGVIGPLCILYHCNFQLGAANSNIALLCMGLMVGSGLIGRFIYGKIHYGLYGQRATLQELQKQMQASEQALRNQRDASLGDAAFERLRALEIFALQRRSFFGNIARLLTIGRRTRAEHKWFVAHLGKLAVHSEIKHEVLAQIHTFLAVIKRIAGISFYERLFSLWHVLHMPIFFMLVVTGLIHVYAVHLY